MGILDDIQQMQMNQVQQGAQQQGFTQPQVPDQPISQIGAGGASAQPQPDQSQQPSSAPGGLQEAMSNYAGWLLQKAQGLQQYSGGAGNRFKQGVAAAAAHQAGIPSDYEAQLQNLGAQDAALKSATGVQNSGLQQQQLDLQRSMVTLPNGMSVPLALAKTLFPAYLRSDTSQANNERNNATKKLVNGYNDDGSVRPLSSLSVPQQVKAQASSALNLLNKARTDAVNMNTKLAPGKLAVLEANARANLSRAATAAGMEKIAADKFAADYVNGMQDENGNPMGLKQASLNLPTADRQRRGDLAANAQHNLDQIKAIVERRPDIFGKIGGSVAHLDDLLGSNDPDIRAIAVLGDQYALPSVGAHGLRAKGAVQQVKDDLLRSMRGGPQGFKGAYDAASSSFGSLINDQQLGKRARPTVPSGSGAPSGGVITLTDGGKSYKIPAALKASFLKDHPNAR